jgi:acyl carrier protein
MDQMISNTETVFAKIVELISANTGTPAAQITMESSFQNLGLDSLDALALINDLEEEYSIKIPNTEVLKIRTIGQAVESLSSRI